jgi:hypothetical protein
MTESEESETGRKRERRREVTGRGGGIYRSFRVVSCHY